MDEEHSINEFDDEEIKAILREALKTRLAEKRAIPRRNQLNIALSSALCEFLDCYKLLGFDVDGNPVNLTVYHNKMEKNALDSQFMEEFGSYMNNRNR